MKKVFAILLALVMVLAFAATAVADNPGAGDTQLANYTDLGNTKAEWVTAIYKLTALGVLQGDGIGTSYRPDANLTRAEFAVIADFLAGVDDQIELYASVNSAFADGEGWFKGAIGAANANGLMVGRGAKKFDPNGKVTMQEVAAVLCRILGYSKDEAYPSWTNAKAVAIGLTAYVDYKPAKYITRAEMASLAAETLNKYAVVKSADKSGITQSLGLADKDGYQYYNWSTNETAMLSDIISYPYVVKSILAAYEGKPLEYTVFGCVDLTDVMMGTSRTQRGEKLEARGWGYTCFDKGQIGVVLNFYGLETEDQAYVAELKGSYRRKDEVVVPFADKYVINGGNITDLAKHYGTLTIEVANTKKAAEVKFININSTSTLVGTTEYFSYEKAGINQTKATKTTPAYYYKRNYNEKDNGDTFGIVKAATAKAVTFVNSDATAITLTGEDVVFYNMDTKAFITPDKLVKGDVIYYAGDVSSSQNYKSSYNKSYPNLYLVYNASAATAGKYNSTFVTLGGVEYKALYNSLYSWDGLTHVAYYDSTCNLDTEVTFAPAYVPGYFSYVADNSNSYGYGVINRYVKAIKAADGHKFSEAAVYEATGVEMVLADGSKVVYEIADLDDFLDNPAFLTGSLVNFTLDKEGHITGFGDMDKGIATADFYADGTTAEYYTFNVDATYNAFWYNDINKSGWDCGNGYGKWNDIAKVKTVYVLESEYNNGYLYELDSAKVVDAAEFFTTYAKGFYAAQAFYNTTDCILWLVDVEGAKSNGYGVATKNSVYFNAGAREGYVTVNGTEYKLDAKFVGNLDLTNYDLLLFQAQDGVIIDCTTVKYGTDKCYATVYGYIKCGKLDTGNQYIKAYGDDHTFKLGSKTYYFVANTAKATAGIVGGKIYYSADVADAINAKSGYNCAVMVEQSKTGVDVAVTVFGGTPSNPVSTEPDFNHYYDYII